MTEAVYGYGPEPSAPPARVSAGRIVNFLGAVTSVALLAGAAWWGYRLAVLDVSGVPVLQAAKGPMRVAPADPGGRIAPHVGLSVNAVVGAASVKPPAQVMLAPPAATLAPEDALPRPATAAAAAPDPALAMQEAVDRALSEAAAADDPGNGLTRSLRPRARPGSAPLAAAEPELTAIQTVAAVAVPEVDPATLRPGTRLAQLGAFDDAETARAEWDRIALRAGTLMDGKARILQPATSAGRAFVRLRVASFDNEDEARRFCAAIESGDLRCIPVTHR